MKFNNPPQIIDKKAVYTVKDINLDTYMDFLQIRTLPHYKVNKKTIIFDASYIDNQIVEQSKLPIKMQEGHFDYAKVICQVAFYKERYAIYADAGLGKTYMIYQIALLILALSKKIEKKIIICVPLQVLHQFMEMADFFDDMPPMVNLHNNKNMTLKEWCFYDNVPQIGFVNHHMFINPQELKNVGAFFLDEAHILRGGKGGNGKIAKHLTEAVKDVKYRIAASATPAPNDPSEYGMIEWWLGLTDNYGSFLGDWFVLKGDKLQLKRHSHKRFYSHLASYSIFIKNPKTYGFNDNLKDLIPARDIYKRIELTPEQHEIIKKYAVTKTDQMMLKEFVYKPSGMVQRNKFSEISKGFLYTKDKDNHKKRIIRRIKSNKPQSILDCVLSHPNKQIIIAVYFDEEGKILNELLRKKDIDCIHLTGKNKLKDKVQILNDFRLNKFPVLIAQSSLISTGLNLQFCHIMIISGMTDSYAEYYQLKKRIDRLGQTEQCLFYHFFTSYEEAILTNVLGKKSQHERDIEYQEKLYKDSLYDELKDFLELGDYRPIMKQKIQHQFLSGDGWQIYHTDALKTMLKIAKGNKDYGWLKPNSVDLSIQSPPFPALDKMTYSSDEADMSNHKNSGALASKDEFLLNMRFWFRGLLQVTKPGRYAYVHMEDVPYRKGLDGGVRGIFDFPGHANIIAEEEGWMLQSKTSILKNQQMQGSVKHVSNLLISSMAKDRLRISPAINGYLYIYQKPGDANVRIADVYKCQKCKKEGYCSELLGYDINLAKRQLEIKMPHFNLCLCPECKTANPLIFSEMDGNKWILYAEGGWVEGCFDKDVSHWANIKKPDRWIDIFKQYADILYGHLGVWPDINEFDILKNPFRGAKNANDLEDADKHLAPLPLSVARRAIILHSNPGDLVLSSFMGSGTEAVEALKSGRNFVGLELNPTYYKMAHANIVSHIAKNQQFEMFPSF